MRDVQELQFWKERCESLKEALEATRLHRAAVEKGYLGGSLLSEDFYSYRQSLKAENLALTEYSRALRIYADLAIHGRVLDDEADTARGA